jgi:predicted dehydrogenase
MWLATKERPHGDAITPPEPPPHLQSATAHFLHAIATGAKLFPLCDPAICRDAQEIMEAGLRSSRSGARIPLPLDPTGG